MEGFEVLAFLLVFGLDNEVPSFAGPVDEERVVLLKLHRI